MPLTCGCYNYDDPDYWVWEPDDYSVMPTMPRRRRCSSCGSLINPGEIVAKFERTRYARDDVEIAIYGDEETAITMASKWHCEECADLYFSLTELGFCVMPNESMRDLVREYSAVQKQTRGVKQ